MKIEDARKIIQEELLLALFQFMECGILLIVMLKCKVQGFLRMYY